MVHKNALFACVLCIIYTSCLATDWYVRPATGEYGVEDGTSYANAFDGFADHNAACASIQAGDTVLIDGTFSEEQLVPCNGSVSGKVTYTAYNSSIPPVLDANGSTTSPIKVFSTQYVDIVGPMTLQNVGAASVIWGYQNNYLTIDGVTIQGCGASGITNRNATNYEVKNSVVTGCAMHAVYADIGSGGSASEISVHDNLLTDNLGTGIRIVGDSGGDYDRYDHVYIYRNQTLRNGDGIYVAFVDLWWAYDNISTDNTLTTYGPSEQYGIGVQQCSNGKIYRNIIGRNTTAGIQFYGNLTVDSHENEVFSNFIFGHDGLPNWWQSGAVECAGNATNPINGCRIYGNILVNNKNGIRTGTDPTNRSIAYNNTIVGGTHGIIFTLSNNSGWSIKNNILTSNRWLRSEGSGNTHVIDNNLYWDQAGIDSSYNGVTYTSANIASLDTGALTSDPSFGASGSSQAKEYYQPSAGSPVYDAGVHVPQRGDVRGGTCVGGTPDIGAYCNDIVIQEGYTLRPKSRRQ